MFPLNESGLFSKPLMAARIISFFWRNDQWLGQLNSLSWLPIPSFTNAMSNELLPLLTCIAFCTEVEGKRGTGIPVAAMKAFEEALNSDKSDPLLFLQTTANLLRKAHARRTRRAKQRAIKRAAESAGRTMEEELEEGESGGSKGGEGQKDITG